MSTCTIVIADGEDNTFTMEGHLDPVNAIDLPPTPAVIIGSYIAANIGGIEKAAAEWFNGQVRESQS